jgi:hypothetical protein
MRHVSEDRFRNVAAGKRTARSGADEFGCAMERHGLESVGVEWSDGAEDDEEESFVGWANSNGALSANCKGMCRLAKTPRVGVGIIY